MRKNFTKIIAFLLCMVMLVGFVPVQAKAATIPTITVTKSTDKIASQIHEKINKGTAVNLKVKGDGKSSEKVVKDLKSKIKKVNKQGVIFNYKKKATAKGYTTYEISSENAKLYKYSVSFVKKLYSIERKKLSTDRYKMMYEDAKKYPNQDERYLRIAYDYLVNYATQRTYMMYESQAVKDKSNPELSWLDWNEFEVVGNSEKTTLTPDLWENDGFWKFEDLELMINRLVKDADVELGYTDWGAEIQNLKSVTLRDFDEFINTDDTKKKILEICDSEMKWYHNTAYPGSYASSPSMFSGGESYRLLMSNQEAAICQAADFYKLSEAMKIWAIGDSDYFGCHYARPEYGMLYEFIYYGDQGSKGMKTLLDNKASGVCQVYANYEILLFKQLGITCYFNSNRNLNHAWSVVKVKNKDGKVMWIPFDYGVGPADGLQVSDSIKNKYLKTEAMRYKTYLAGIKDAPTKKNFKDSDFK